MCQLGLAERQDEDLNASAYLKVLGNEVRFGMLKTDNIIQYLQDYARQLIGEIVMLCQIVYLCLLYVSRNVMIDSSFFLIIICSNHIFAG